MTAARKIALLMIILAGCTADASAQAKSVTPMSQIGIWAAQASSMTYTRLGDVPLSGKVADRKAELQMYSLAARYSAPFRIPNTPHRICFRTRRTEFRCTAMYSWVEVGESSCDGCHHEEEDEVWIVSRRGRIWTQGIRVRENWTFDIGPKQIK